jgi:hypothetical protein
MCEGRRRYYEIAEKKRPLTAEPELSFGTLEQHARTGRFQRAASCDDRSILPALEGDTDKSVCVTCADWLRLPDGSSTLAVS